MYKTEPFTNVVKCTAESCEGVMNVSVRSNRAAGVSMKCSKSGNHEISIFKNSFFERSKLNIRDMLMFVKCYLDGCSLYQCAIFAGLSYGGTSVDWASFVGEITKEY